MRPSRTARLCVLLTVCVSGCQGMHPRPANVPSSAVWVDNVFIDCATDTRADANHCTVYTDNTGEILADGRFVLGSSHLALEKSDLHYVAFGRRGIYLEDARILVKLVPTRRDPSSRVLDAQLRALAASGGPETPLNCNSADSTSTGDAITECALKAFVARRPFYVRYYSQMPNSFGYTAFAGDAGGNVYAVEWYSGDEFPPGERSGKAFDGGHGLISLCPTPAGLAKMKAGTLVCTLPASAVVKHPHILTTPD
jgi:hypothetical protein